MTSTEPDSLRPPASHLGEELPQHQARHDEQRLEQEDLLDDRDSGSAHSDHSADHNMGASKARDPLKPKRKKARRACAACQRAHLTCDDHRPCQRCIKRNLADQCHDGARKKAKYLHDAPNEILMPGHGGSYGSVADYGSSAASSKQPAHGSSGLTQSNAFMTPGQPAGFPSFAHPTSQPSMPQYFRDGSAYGMTSNQQSPTTPQFSPHQPSSIQHIQSTGSHASSSTPLSGANQPYAPSFLDAQNEPAMYGADAPSVKFDNRYGALEFGMLGQIASDMSGNALPSNQSPAMSSNAFGSQIYDDPTYIGMGFESQDYLGMNGDESSPASGSWRSNQDGQGRSMQSADLYQGGFQNGSRRNSHGMLRPFAVGPTSADLPSNQHRSTNPQTGSYGGPSRDSSGFSDSKLSMLQGHKHQQQERSPQRHRDHLATTQNTRELQSSHPSSQNGPNDTIAKRLQSIRHPTGTSKKHGRDPSEIYTRVKDPYPYTTAFHALTAVLSRRFSSKKRLKIAVALASIRPSFISLNRRLMNCDLVFMEQCFQRGLLDYEDFSNACGTPTIVCRRTGEVAHVGHEFTIMTGWRKEVLLGLEPNLNTNTPRENNNLSGTATSNSSRGGFNTPKPSQQDDDSARQEAAASSTSTRKQPVFLAELLDDDSAVRFYEDYAKLAFADSKGSAWAPCNVLKYKPRDTGVKTPAPREEESSVRSSVPSRAASGESEEYGKVKKEPKGSDAFIAPGRGLADLGEEEGKVKCMYCWMVKRDVFNIPMMIVVNVGNFLINTHG
ncbi:MAG: Transcriptional regulator of nonfermentable carbon utilization [Alyxoria varia]|nr:MAG: Transcriptional regulator of nonfermentable carbon utilization [Alyxoria varia]